jgi:hypothetical protein
MQPDADIVDSLRAGGFLAPDATPQLERLAGGVSSDVFRLETWDGPVCVKRALATLRVAAVWEAPVERSHYEVDWLRTARAFVGETVPQVLFEDRAGSLFVMNFYDPATHSVWKSDLAAGRVDPELARKVGALLVKVHAGAAGSTEIAARFQTTDLFEDLRLAPFLRHCALAQRWPTARRRRGSPWCTATSARRTSSAGRPGRCCWTPSAPGMATRPSTWRSARRT